MTEQTAMNPNKALWEKGDFTKIANSMRESGAAVSKSLNVGPGIKVLDLGCGDGTTALPSAELGAEVLGVDIASNLVAAGNRRANEAGLTKLRFEEGDASNLDGIADESFDLIVTMFGAMFAPRPFDVAKEMMRVTKSGGKIFMGNWIPGDPTLIAQVLRIVSNYTPPPPEGFVSPMTWGVEGQVRERFLAAGASPEDISFERGTFTFDFAGTSAEFVETFRDYYGPTMNAFDAARANGKEKEFEAELVELFEKENRSDVPDRTVIPANYLRVTVKK